MVKRRRGGTRHRLSGFLWLAALGLYGFLGLYGYGCGSFSIRDPVQPAGGGLSCKRLNPSNEDSVLANFAQSIECKLDGTSLYSESLADSFWLIVDPLDVADMVEPRDSLSKSQDVAAQERRVSDAAAADTFSFSFGSMKPTETTDKTAFYLDMPYELFLIRQDSTQTDTIKGKADITVQEITTGTWALIRWVDKRQDPYTSFGRWHAEVALDP